MTKKTVIEVLEIGSEPIEVKFKILPSDMKKIHSQAQKVFVLSGIQYDPKTLDATIRFNPGRGVFELHPEDAKS